MNGLMSPAEGPAPFYNGAPPTQQPFDLKGAFAMLRSIIFRDGGMDPEEQRIFIAEVQSIQMEAQARAQMAMQAGAAPDQGLGSSSAVGDYNPMSGQNSSPAPGYEDYDDEDSYG